MLAKGVSFMTIAEALKRFRLNKGLTQAEVADKLGIFQQAYYRYEKGKIFPPVLLIVKMANTFNVSADYLLGLSDEPHAKKYDDEEVKKAFALRDALKEVMTKNSN